MVESTICFDTSETQRNAKSMLHGKSWTKDSAFEAFLFILQIKKIKLNKGELVRFRLVVFYSKNGFLEYSCDHQEKLPMNFWLKEQFSDH